MFPLPLEILFLFVVTTPFVGWLLAKKNRQNLCGAYVSLGLLISGIALYSLFLTVFSGSVVGNLTSVTAGFRIDMLSVFMAAISIGLGLLVTVYSIKDMENDTRTMLYYTLLTAMISGMVGVAFAGDLFTLYVFWELMCVSSYVLVAFRKTEWEPIEAGLKYLIMSAAGSATLLLGMSLLYGMTGTLNFQSLAAALTGARQNAWLSLSFLLILIGFGVKASIVPLHTWLPDTYSAAPTPISALLSGAVTETGVYALARTLFSAFLAFQVQWGLVLAVLSIITMTLGNITALMQKDIKRLLAYSSIAQIGYMLVGIAVGTQLGLTGTFLQILNHALMKGTAFLCAGAIIYRIGTRQLGEMGGIGRKMPLTAVGLAISLFALTGIPPLNGFVGELTLLTSAVQANMSWLGIAIILNSILSAGYYLQVIRVLVEPASSEKLEKVKEAPLIMLVPICIMTVLIILFGVYPDPVLVLARKAAQSLLSMGG
ncbi:MAG TPA: NADH-quinone oxidoreductase subunit M [Candidatus Bathyarchaeia archaeon]|nr:NADH-quinone oxidoreductase subunit M [Candidatus Bathyarchaeia archaeon]